MVVAAIVNTDGRVLIARRPSHVHQGGLWEFPGGKLEPGEDIQRGLRRELYEELGIEVLHARPLIRIPYQYPDRHVLLDVWRVEGFSGVAQGCEGQEVRWVEQSELSGYAFPPPNRPIINALRLPDRYLITPEPGPVDKWPIFLDILERTLTEGVRLVQLRSKQLNRDALSQLAMQVLDICRRRGALLLLNAAPELVMDIGADGVHLSSELARQYFQRPSVTTGLLVGVSCHSAIELSHACTIGADFALLSPVLPTNSHPGTPALGWDRFAQLTVLSTIPVYALGGMMAADIPMAIQCGGQGIAAISGLWGEEAI